MIPMKIRLLSDLHLEISDFTPARAEADVMILAGDIHLNTRGLDWAAEHFAGVPLLYVAGNHEFYHRDLDDTLAQLRARAADLGFHLLENDELVLQGVRFLGATLWTDFALFGPQDREARQRFAGRLMSDHELIRLGDRRFAPEDARHRHEQSVAWLRSRLAVPFAGPTVVVTHHAPSPRSIPDRYVGDSLSPAFASDLEALVAGADAWIHGHTHAFRDYRVGNCRVLSTPRGYVSYRKQEYTGFVDPLVIEIA